jgi:serine/threonine protein kinase
MPLSSGQVINNRYRIDSLLGHGDQGAVYHAWDLTLNTPVALKEFLGDSPEAAHQFGLEARLLANLRHENLPYVIDHFDLPGGGHYLVMEFVEGQDLQSMIERTGKGLQEASVLFWIGKVCDGLAFLHAQSPPIFHRDVKPANIKITPKGQVVLVDYGIAKNLHLVWQSTVRAGAPMHGFIPPEQFSGAIDARGDVYALGATLYAALTGRDPLDSRQRQVGQSFPTPRQINPAITPGTEAAILRAMELSPEERFQSVDDFRNALNIPLAPPQRGQVYVQPSGDGTYELPSTPQRRSSSWVMWAIIVLVGLCLVGGVVGGVGAYFFIFAPQPTATPLVESGLAATATALASQLAPPIPTTAAPQTATESASPQASHTPTVTILPSFTPSPSVTPTSSLEATQTSNVQATWQPCVGIYPSRLHVGDKAYISYNPPLPNRVRTQPNTNADVVGFLQPGEQMDILEGPVCSNQWIWWRVRSLSTGMTGWTAEGDATNYWLVPMP